MSDNLITPTAAQISEAESLSFIFEKLLSSKIFINLVKITAVRGTAPNLVVDALPLVAEVRSQDQTIILGTEVFSIPVWRLQRGNSAIVMDPVVGDIGVMGVFDTDTTVARKTRKESVPGSKRNHSRSDGFYFGGLLNMPPTQFIEFADNALNITSPNPVNITCTTANVNAPGGMNITTPLMKVTGSIEAGGDITDNSGTQAASLKTLRDAFNDHDHEVKSVQSGNDTKTSEKPGNPV